MLSVAREAWLWANDPSVRLSVREIWFDIAKAAFEIANQL